MNSAAPEAVRIAQGFAVAALVLGDGDGSRAALGVAPAAAIAVALRAQRGLSRSERRAFLHAVLARRAPPDPAVVNAPSPAAARARRLLAARAQGVAIGSRADAQLVAFLGRLLGEPPLPEAGA